MWNLENNTNELTYETKQTHRHWKETLWLSKGKWWGVLTVYGINRCTPPYTK